MLEKNMYIDLRPVLHMQHHILHRIKYEINDLSEAFSEQNEVRNKIDAADKIIAEIENNIEFLKEEDFSGFNTDDIMAIYDRKNQEIRTDLKLIEFYNWRSFVRDCQTYTLFHNIDPFLPYEALLSVTDMEILRSELYDKQYRWDKWDYIFVGSSGILAALTDIMCVKIPLTMDTGQFSGQEGSQITKWLHSIKFPKEVQEWLEKVSKVPYDRTGGGDHRINTAGHDPVLGFIFGVIDIMRGGVKNPLEAILCQFLHMVSDVATKRGLPIPFSSVFRLLNVGCFKSVKGKERTISDLSLWMYHNGYDLRHFITMGITPATIEIFLRTYLMIRHYSEHGETKFILADSPKYRSMLLVAHSIASVANVGKVSLYQGNPLAINYAEWLALFRYLLPHIKYWVFDKHNFKIEHMEKINENSWNELLNTNDEIFKKIISTKIEHIELGKA